MLKAWFFTFMVQSVLSSYFLLLFGLAEAELKNSPNYPEETLELFILQMIFFFFFFKLLHFGKQTTEALQG